MSGLFWAFLRRQPRWLRQSLLPESSVEAEEKVEPPNGRISKSTQTGPHDVIVIHSAPPAIKPRNPRPSDSTESSLEADKIIQPQARPIIKKTQIVQPDVVIAPSKAPAVNPVAQNQPNSEVQFRNPENVIIVEQRSPNEYLYPQIVRRDQESVENGYQNPEPEFHQKSGYQIESSKPENVTKVHASSEVEFRTPKTENKPKVNQSSEYPIEHAKSQNATKAQLENSTPQNVTKVDEQNVYNFNNIIATVM